MHDNPRAESSLTYGCYIFITRTHFTSRGGERKTRSLLINHEWDEITVSTEYMYIVCCFCCDGIEKFIRRRNGWYVSRIELRGVYGAHTLADRLLAARHISNEIASILLPIVPAAAAAAAAANRSTSGRLAVSTRTFVCVLTAERVNQSAKNWRAQCRRQFNPSSFKDPSSHLYLVVSPS